jgi:CrcB protein
MRLLLFLAVAAGAFVGEPCRYLVDRTISRRIDSELPWGKFTINMTGFLLLGLLTGLALGHHLPALPRALLATGFCGAYTTFSTFTYESVRLLEDGQLLEAAGNVAVSVAVGLGAAALGLAIGLAH